MNNNQFKQMLDDFSEGIVNQDLINYRENIKTALDIEKNRNKKKDNLRLIIDIKKPESSSSIKTNKQIKGYIICNLIMFEINEISFEE
jgi:hypothetical protein